jgi:hypothetical protein
MPSMGSGIGRAPVARITYFSEILILEHNLTEVDIQEK